VTDARELAALFSPHVRASPGQTILLLQPTHDTVLDAAVATGATVHVAHRKWPAVLRLRERMRVLGGDAMQVRHAHGTRELSPDVPADLVVITIPEERIGWQQLLFDGLSRLRHGGRLLVGGANDVGAKPAAKLVARCMGHARVLAQGGGQRVFDAVRGEACDLTLLRELVAPWDDPEAMQALSWHVAGHPAHVFTRPGVFSWEHIDEASAILADVMTPEDATDVLDLGCGAGVLGVALAHRAPNARVTLVDADSDAVRCAERTMRETGHAAFRVLASDVTSAVADDRFDLVVSNPPFHDGKQVDLALSRRFVEEAFVVLRRGGRLQLVANRTLPYEGELERVFGNRRTLHDGVRFKVLEARRP
jgi:16S rRNA (guanine1207-N2)-methyltransferase